MSCVKGCLQVVEKEETWTTLRCRWEGRKWLLIRDEFCFRMVFQSAEVEELEMGWPAIGPDGSMCFVLEEVKRASWEVLRDGGVS